MWGVTSTEIHFQPKANGQALSSKRIRRTNTRYLCVADVQKCHHSTVDHCPTDEMVRAFFTNPVGGANFCRFCNTTTHTSHDKHGPVDMDEMITIHNDQMLKRFDMVLEGSIADSYRKHKHNNSKEHKTSAKVSSQECAEDMSTRSNIRWASIRDAHKQSKDNTPSNRGHIHRRTYTEVATPVSEYLASMRRGSLSNK